MSVVAKQAAAVQQSLEVERIRQHPGQQQVSRAVKVSVPGKHFPQLEAAVDRSTGRWWSPVDRSTSTGRPVDLYRSTGRPVDRPVVVDRSPQRWPVPVDR